MTHIQLESVNIKLREREREMRDRERLERWKREMRETFHIKVSHRKNTEFYKHMICCSEVLVADFYLSVPLANCFSLFVLKYLHAFLHFRFDTDHTQDEKVHLDCFCTIAGAIEVTLDRGLCT